MCAWEWCAVAATYQKHAYSPYQVNLLHALESANLFSCTDGPRVKRGLRGAIHQKAVLRLEKCPVAVCSLHRGLRGARTMAVWLA